METRTRSVLRLLLDVVELYVPMVTFLTIYVCFMLQIVSRYFFTPLTWPEELALLSFLWTALLGATYAKRDENLVSFTLVYDRLSPRGQTIVRVIGSGLLIAAFVISFKPSLDFVIFQSYKKSSVLYIPMNLVSSAYLVFLVDVTIRYTVDLVRDVRALAAGGLA